jgi:hypothetical protein
MGELDGGRQATIDWVRERFLARSWSSVDALPSVVANTWIALDAHALEVNGLAFARSVFARFNAGTCERAAALPSAFDRVVARCLRIPPLRERRRFGGAVEWDQTAYHNQTRHQHPFHVHLRVEVG